MSEPSETLPILEQRFAEHLLALALLDKTQHNGLAAIERARVLARIAALQGRIVSVQSEALADVAV